MSELKVGDKVWVQCYVLELGPDRACKVEGSLGGTFWTTTDHCKPVEPDPEPEVGFKWTVVERRASFDQQHITDLLLRRVDSLVVGKEYWVAGVKVKVESLPPRPVIKESLNTEIDAVNPSHYKQGSIECIEAIKAALGKMFNGFLWGNVLKYLWRWPDKNGIEDLKKARWYLDRLIKEVGE